MGLELVSLQPVIDGKAGELMLMGIEPGNTFICAYPQIAVGVFLYAKDAGAGQSVPDEIVGEPARPCVQVIQSYGGADPYISMAVLEDMVDGIVAKTIVRRVMAIVSECTRLFVEAINATVIRTYPKITFDVYQQGVDPVCGKAVIVKEVMAIMDESIVRCIIQIESTAIGADPYVAVLVDSNGVDIIFAEAGRL